MASRFSTSSVAAPSISHSGSHSQTPSIPASGPSAQLSHIPNTTVPKSETLIIKLNFDRALTTQDQGVGIRVCYQCYTAILDAQQKYQKLYKAGKWNESFTPTQNDFINLVTSRTMWYEQYKRHFEQVERYSEMIEWLQESPDALSDMEIWGFERRIYQWSHLIGYFNREGAPFEYSEGGSEVESQQKKKKRVHRKAALGKVTQGKQRDKGKARKVSSNDEISDGSGSAQKAGKKSTSTRRR